MATRCFERRLAAFNLAVAERMFDETLPPETIPPVHERMKALHALSDDEKVDFVTSILDNRSRLDL